MPDDPTMRAFDLASAGTCRTIEDIRKQLRKEGYSLVDEYLGSRSLQGQLKKLMQ